MKLLYKGESRDIPMFGTIAGSAVDEGFVFGSQDLERLAEAVEHHPEKVTEYIRTTLLTRFVPENVG